jgi:hypothetical protein
VDDISATGMVDPRATPAGASAVSAPSVPRAGAPADDAGGDLPAEPAPAAPPATETAETSDPLPTLDPAALAHFAAIQGALTFRESMLARALAAELSPADLRAWLMDLRVLSVADAVAKVRSVLGPDTSTTAPGGGS